MSRTLLFEIGAEELPPSELPSVIAACRELAARELGDARLSFQALTVYSTPRRLALLVCGLAEAQESRRTTVTGPPKKAAFDASGHPTRAGEGFARSQGVTVDQLMVVTTERGEYVAVDRLEQGRPAGDVLPDVLVRIVASLPFVKQMRWGEGEVRFSRPVRWLVALLDHEVLPVTFAGVIADRVTYGHRFLSPDPVRLAHAGEYADRLEAARVIPDIDRRRDVVRTTAESAGASFGRTVLDLSTLETVLHLVEWPEGLTGAFPKEFLDLPRQVVETPIRHHQRCFVIEATDGRLVPHFVAVSNMPGVDATDIRRGNERVIRARLADADFYFRDDLKTTPDARVALLSGMVFQEKLGTLHEKTERIVRLVGHLAAAAPTAKTDILRRAAWLSKSDLPSGMVREFPELEGVIGEDYAIRAGEPAPVGQAIREHYLPRSADGALPESLEGAILAIADKIDTIVGIVGIGLLPTGSQDPYALRRHAQGIVQIAIAVGDRLRLSLDAVTRQALEGLAAKLTEPPEATCARVLDFFRARLATILAGRGARPDVVEAALASGFDEPRDAARRVQALETLMQREDWEPLVITFKRTINILPPDFRGQVDASRLSHDAERQLHAAIAACREPVRAALRSGDYAEALTRVAMLRPNVDRFFDAVMVMDRDPVVRDTRLALLRDLAQLLLPVADLRKIQAAA
jgi:glycyl-tRNA synthetase beta chain